jgi:dienelactone hydrolase
VDGPTTLETWLSMGCAVFAPSRRGYDGADGQPLREALNRAPDKTPERGRLLVERLLAENDDVIAALAFLVEQPWIDPDRLVCAGYSFGGIMTMLALSRTDQFAAGVNFASAAIVWPDYPAVREMLLARTARITTPTMIIQAENDYSVTPTAALGAVLAERGVPHVARVYPPVGEGPADGHVFCALAGPVWEPDVRQFLTGVGVLTG